MPTEDVDEPEEPGPGPDDALCDCGEVAFYFCNADDPVDGLSQNVPCCTRCMRDWFAEARELGYPFVSRPVQKPTAIEHTCATQPELVCDACTLDMLKRAKVVR